MSACVSSVVCLGCEEGFGLVLFCVELWFYYYFFYDVNLFYVIFCAQMKT